MIRLTNWKMIEAAACSGLLLVAACGDDDGPSPDAAVQADAMPEADAGGEPDAGPAAPSGLIAVTEVTVTDPEAQAANLSGAGVGISWIDPATITVPPVEGFENNIGGCRITVYDVAAGDEPGTAVDTGTVTVTGTASGEFACLFGDTGRYMCQSTDAAAAGEVAVGATAEPGIAGGPATYTFPEVDFSGTEYAGMYLQVDGFTAAEANGTFPIVGVDPQDPSALLVANPDVPALGTTVENDPGSYATAVGAGPVPGGFDFLDGETTLNLSKAAGGGIDALDVDIVANGEGFTLAGDSAQPHAIPTDGTEALFLCPGTDTTDLTGGDCGSNAGGTLQGMTLSGATTDADVSGLRFDAMPAPESQYATFQCSAIGKTGAALSAEAMGVILGTSPTRIQVNVSYMAAAIEGSTNVVAGHTLAGFTDVTPE